MVRYELRSNARYNTVFNIKGNNYRLIADIVYETQRIYIKYVLTHAEYDKNIAVLEWKQLDARDTTTEALAEVIGSLEIALQIVNGDSPSLRDAARTETLRERTISKTQAEALADYFNVDIAVAKAVRTSLLKRKGAQS